MHHLHAQLSNAVKSRKISSLGPNSFCDSEVRVSFLYYIQAFSASDGWPFVGYVGACGRFVAYEAGWSPLSQFMDETWLIRAHLALKLLSIARKLTENKSQYGIYWTDVSFDDFGVEDRSGNVVVVNGRSLMVVDRFQIREDKKPGWDTPLHSKFDDCSDRLVSMSF